MGVVAVVVLLAGGPLVISAAASFLTVQFGGIKRDEGQ